MSKPDLATYGGRLRDIGFAGGLVDENASIIDSKVNDLTIAIDFGNAVARSAADNSCKAPTLDTDKIIGLAARNAIRPADVANNVLYAQRDEVPILKLGFIYVTAFESVVRGDGAISVTAQNGKVSGTTAGAAGVGRVAIPGGIWETTTAVGLVGIVRMTQ